MLKKLPLSVFIVSLFASIVSADLGFDRIIVNNSGRCWRIVNRDFEDANRRDSCVLLKIIEVGGTGQTDDAFAFELIFKEDFIRGQGWDESKTRTYNGTGLVKNIRKGRVNFELYLQPNNQPIEIKGYYHPGTGTSDSDDRMVLTVPDTIANTNAETDCDTFQLEEASTL